jgi:hypothetical protein
MIVRAADGDRPAGALPLELDLREYGIRVHIRREVGEGP